MPTALVAAPPCPAPADTPPPVRTLRTPGYFERRWPAAVILGAFPAVALPMAAAIGLGASDWLLWAFIWLFGMTHFVVTLSVYLRSDNLRHFAASPRNVLVFFVVPGLLFVGFDLYHAFRVGALFPVFGVVFLAAIRLADFNHFNRQTFGVLQLFKARTGAKFPPALKRTENLFFGTLTGLTFVTFLAGGTCPLVQPGGPLTVLPVIASFFPALLPLAGLQVAWAGLAVIAAALFGVVVVGLVKAGGGRAKLRAALGYLLVQTAAALMAATYFPLYLAALAVHYVEYHVLMAPRCLRATPAPAGRVDRVFAGVRSRPVVFYGLVLAVAGLVTLGARAGMGMMGHSPASAGEPFGYLALIAVFDGLFVFHYFVEMFIWRFGDPHFRRELSGLYFGTAK